MVLGWVEPPTRQNDRWLRKPSQKFAHHMSLLSPTSIHCYSSAQSFFETRSLRLKTSICRCLRSLATLDPKGLWWKACASLLLSLRSSLTFTPFHITCLSSLDFLDSLLPLGFLSRLPLFLIHHFPWFCNHQFWNFLENYAISPCFSPHFPGEFRRTGSPKVRQPDGARGPRAARWHPARRPLDLRQGAAAPARRRGRRGRWGPGSEGLAGEKWWIWSMRNGDFQREKVVILSMKNMMLTMKKWNFQ